MSNLQILESESGYPSKNADFITSSVERRKLVKAVDAFGRDVGEASWQVAVALDSVALALSHADMIVGYAEELSGDWEVENIVQVARRAVREAAEMQSALKPVRENISTATEIMSVASSKRSSELDGLSDRFSDYCRTLGRVSKLIRSVIDNDGNAERGALDELVSKSNELKTHGAKLEKYMQGELKRLETERLKWLEKPS